MPKLRVFISSTYYDLKHLRGSLESFVRSLGHEPILWERGSITVDPSNPLEESCYAEIGTCDICVLIIGGSFGNLSASTKSLDGESITMREHRSALEMGIPVYVFVEKSVLAEYKTFLKNRNNDKVEYAHANVRIFRFIEQIYNLVLNNYVSGFETPSEIEGLLRDQWSGLFRDLLKSRSQYTGVATIASEVNRLAATSSSFDKYLRVILEKLEPQKAHQIITEEEDRLNRIREQEIQQNSLGRYILTACDIESWQLVSALQNSGTAIEFISAVNKVARDHKLDLEIGTDESIIQEMNVLRRCLGLNPFPPTQSSLRNYLDKATRELRKFDTIP